MDINHDTPATVICAWCRTVLNDGVGPASHGVCPICLEQQLDGLALVPYQDVPGQLPGGTEPSDADSHDADPTHADRTHQGPHEMDVA